AGRVRLCKCAGDSVRITSKGGRTYACPGDRRARRRLCPTILPRLLLAISGSRQYVVANERPHNLCTIPWNQARRSRFIRREGRQGAPGNARRVSAVASSDPACFCPRRRAIRQQSAQTVVRLAAEQEGLLLLRGGRTGDRI